MLQNVLKFRFGSKKRQDYVSSSCRNQNYVNWGIGCWKKLLPTLKAQSCSNPSLTLHQFYSERKEAQDQAPIEALGYWKKNRFATGWCLLYFIWGGEPSFLCQTNPKHDFVTRILSKRHKTPWNETNNKKTFYLACFLNRQE